MHSLYELPVGRLFTVTVFDNMFFCFTLYTHVLQFMPLYTVSQKQLGTPD